MGLSLCCRWICCCLLLSFSFSGYAQPSSAIEGIVNDENNEPLAFVSVVNLTTRQCTITSQAGEFVLSASAGDSVLFTFVGYHRHVIRLQSIHQELIVTLQTSPQLLNEVTIKASDDKYLYDLFKACKQQAPKETHTSKAYFELRSFAAGQQTELVEGYFNATSSGYTLDALDMKAGRFGFQLVNNRFFTSIDASAALRRLDIFSNTSYLPANPFSLSASAFRKQYYLDVIHQYYNDQRDSIYVIRAIPRDTSGRYFETIATINASQKLIKRVQLLCKGAASLPFRPLFRMDSIQHASLHINLTFTDAPVNLQHIDLRYTVKYKSRNEYTYDVSAQSVLYCYDHDDPFWLPYFTFADPEIADYRKINVIQYDEVFWNNQQFRPGDRRLHNLQFYHDSNTVTSVFAYGHESMFGYRGIFHQPFVAWSTDRVRLKEIIEDTIVNNFNTAELTASKYNISAKLYLDVNQWRDTLRVTTRAILDPFETYYRLPLDSAAQCAINIYFDIAEIERRELEREILASDGSRAVIDSLYHARVDHLEEMKMNFFGSVNRGTDMKAMEEANALIVAMLGIDNMALFGMAGKKE
jgi:hypothetical protein